MLAKIRRRLPILTLTAAHGAVDFYLGLIAVLAPGLAAYLGVPLGDVVFLVGASNLFTNACQPLIGYAMGRRNMSWVLCPVVIVAALPCFSGYANGFYSLAFLVLLGAIGTGVYHPEAALSASDSAGRNSQFGIPFFLAGGAAIYAAGTPLAIKWTEWFGYPALAWFALPALALSAMLLFQYHDLRRKHPSVVLRPRSKRITRALEGHMSFWPLLCMSVCFGIGNGVFMSTLSSHYELVFGPEARVWSGWILMAWGIVGSLASFAWTALAAKRGFFLIGLISQAVAFPLFLLMAWPSSPVAGFFVALPLTFCSPGALNPVVVTISRNAAGLTQGLRTSLVMGGTAGLSSIAVMSAGRLLRGGMPSSYLMIFCALCSLVAMLLSLWQLFTARSAQGLRI